MSGGDELTIAYSSNVITKLRKEFDEELRRIISDYKPSDNEDSIAYIDTCAQDNVWRIDSGMKYLKEIDRQYGKAVVGVTGDKKALSYRG